MSTYEDFWKQAGEGESSPKDSNYQFVNNNIDRVQLSPDEQYKMGWGPDGVSEVWIKQKALELQQKIDSDVSTSILRGTGVAPVQKATDAASTVTDQAVSTGITRAGGSSGSRDTTSGPHGNGTNLSDSEWSSVKTMRDDAGGMSDYDKANASAFGRIAAGLVLGGPLGAIAGVQRSMPNLDSAKSLLAAQGARETAATEAMNNPIAYGTPEANAIAAAYREYGDSRTGGNAVTTSTPSDGGAGMTSNIGSRQGISTSSESNADGSRGSENQG